MSVARWEAALRARLLTSEGPWQRVEVHEEIDSTNAQSLRDPTPWRLIVAGHQSAGRGRRSRVWESPRGSSVSMSVTVPVPSREEDFGWLPLLTGVAMVQALGRLTADAGRFGLKWPNDILALEESARARNPDRTSPRSGTERGRRWGKVCGILAEVAGPDLVVVGVGVNVRVPVAALPTPLATSLHLCGHPQVSRCELVGAFAEQFAVRYGQWLAGGAGLADLRQDYRRMCRSLGAIVDVHAPGGMVVTGRAVAVDPQGRIVVDTTTGPVVFSAGDVVHATMSV